MDLIVRVAAWGPSWNT